MNDLPRDHLWEMHLVNEETGQITIGLYNTKKDVEAAVKKYSMYKGYHCEIRPPRVDDDPEDETVKAHSEALHGKKEEPKKRKGRDHRTDTPDRQFYYKELMSEECACGESKKKGFSFCYSCYQQLDGGMKKDLYQKIGYGYEEAYNAALKVLLEM